jgi:pimeloyl-ACP methyl ester carboxylesterase
MRGAAMPGLAVAWFCPAVRRLAVAGLLLVLAACIPAADVGAAVEPGEELHRVPVTGADGTMSSIVMRLCRPEPAAAAPVRLVLINHGAPANANDRPTMRPASCGSEAVGWFRRHGFAVAVPMRRGYGPSGGTYVEGNGACASPDYPHSGNTSADDITAALQYAAGLPGIRADGITVVGQSAGGWATVALAARNRPDVAALVSMAGGRGGWAGGVAGVNCRADLLAEAAGHFGAGARAVPMLWVYTANDSFFAPPIAQAMHRAFTGAGGQAELHELAGWRRDGHGLFFAAGGSEIWGPIVEVYLRARGVL